MGGRAFTSPSRRAWAAVHDAVIAAGRACAARAGAAPAQHLRGGPADQPYQVPFRPAPVQPGVAEMMPEPMLEHIRPALAAPARDHLVDPVGGPPPAVVHPEPQLRPPRLHVPAPESGGSGR